MNIRMGNLSIKEMEQKLGIEFPNEIREFMGRTHQDKASKIEIGKWHCFDIPFNLVCGDVDTATIIVNSIKDREDEIKEGLLVSLSE